MIRIFVVTHANGVAQAMWLCDSDAEARGAKVELKAPKDFAGRCDDCSRARQASPGYVSPTIDYAPTSAHPFKPGPRWRPDPPVKPWPKMGAARERQTTSPERAA